MKKWSFLLGVAILSIIVVFTLNKVGLMKSITSEELAASIEIEDVETKWVDKYYQSWPPKLILVPAISFRVKNVTDKPLTYINFNAVFRFKNDYENLGDCFLAAIRREPVNPGETSKVILLKSNYGIEAKNLASFKNNPQWKTVIVKLFSQSKGSQFVNLGEWEVSKKIDFKEPEPVNIEKKEEKLP